MVGWLVGGVVSYHGARSVCSLRFQLCPLLSSSSPFLFFPPPPPTPTPLNPFSLLANYVVVLLDVESYWEQKGAQVYVTAGSERRFMLVL